MGYPFRTIVCPVDFSDNSLSALGLARHIAADAQGVIHLVHAVPTVLPESEAEEAYRGEEAETAARLRAVAEERLVGVEYKVHVPVGVTAEAVTDVATTLNADLVVIATHGRHGLSRFFLGSAADAIIRRAPCPVLVVRFPHEDDQHHS